jgi:hypothetical protein
MNAALEMAMATAIGAVIEHPDHASHVFATARIEDFDAQYRLVAEAIHGLRLSKKSIDTLAVIDEMTRRGTLGTIGGQAEVHRIAGFGFGSPEYAVQVIATESRRRRIWEIGTRAAGAAELDDAEPFTIAQTMVEKAQAIVDGIEAEGDVSTPTLKEFVATEDAPYDWVIPGLLERGDRFILTGSEGLGKSVLARQIAVCTAAGVHPFTHQPIPPQRVLYVDCENGVTKLRRAFRPLAIQAAKHGADPGLNMFVEARPEGLDLTKPEDEMWLVRHVAMLQPALLVTGPVYRLHAKNPNDEEPARQVTRVLDRCRAAANCALMLEAHAGHGYGTPDRPVRPTGSSLWLRWPEFGYGLRAGDNFDPANRNVNFVAWRGDREERQWPSSLRAGGLWPWVSNDAEWSPSGAIA